MKLYDFYRHRYINSHLLSLKHPVDMMLELSSKCNQVCTYCYHSEKEKANLPFKLGYMDKDLALRLIDEAAELGVYSLKFNYRGESTLHPDYYDILKRSKDLSSGLTFIDRIANTNFKIPKSRKAEVFLSLLNLTKVKISFDSFDKKVFEKQRAGGNYDLTLSNIDEFYEYNKKFPYGTKIVIQAVRTKLNKDEDIVGIASSRWPGVSVSVRDMVEGRIDKDLNQYSQDNRNYENRKSCIQAHARIVINHDGMAQMCCPDIKSNLIIGDAKKQSLFDIWNSKKAKSIREELLSKKAFELDPCKTCSSYESFSDYKAPKDS